MIGMDTESFLFVFLLVNCLLFLFRRRLSAIISASEKMHEPSSVARFLFGGIKNPATDEKRVLLTIKITAVINMLVGGIVFAIVLFNKLFTAIESGSISPASAKPSITETLVSHENVPLNWFEQQSEFVRERIEKGEFVLSTLNDEIRVGVASENGDFITWPGSRVMPSGGSSGYLFLRPLNRDPIHF